MLEQLQVYAGHIVTLVAALLGAWVLVWRTKRDGERDYRTAEFSDRTAFRKDLMKDIADLRWALAECQKQHQQAHFELLRLRDENREAMQEISKLKGRIDHLEGMEHNK